MENLLESLRKKPPQHEYKKLFYDAGLNYILIAAHVGYAPSYIFGVLQGTHRPGKRLIPKLDAIAQLLLEEAGK